MKEVEIGKSIRLCSREGWKERVWRDLYIQAIYIFCLISVFLFIDFTLHTLY